MQSKTHYESSTKKLKTRYKTNSITKYRTTLYDILTYTHFDISE